MNKKIRQISLGPLVRRQRNLIDEQAILDSFNRIDDLALGASMLEQLQDVIKNFGTDKVKRKYGDPDRARKMIALSIALYLSRQITKAEYIFFTSYSVEGVFENRMQEGDYENKFSKLNKAMRNIEKKYDLGPDEYWKIGDAPDEYRVLNDQWEAIENNLFINALFEFELPNLAEMVKNNPTSYKRFRERGRRAISHKNEMALIVRDIVIRYEQDAQKAASIGAYSSAITCLGAGLEGLLLLRCFRSKYKACRIAKKLPRRNRPRFHNDITTWTFNNLIQVCSIAKWLPSISTNYANFKAVGLANILRKMRNNIHPGRYAKDKPWSEITERDYKDAHAIYLIMLNKLANIGPKKLKSFS